MINPNLKFIKDRSSVTQFETTPIEEEKLQAILEAGQWAPSWINSQPWKFIVIKNQQTMQHLSEHVPTFHTAGISDAPVCIAVCVDPKEDPHHFIEDGAVATQNMALAAHSLGLGSYWIGVFDLKGAKDSAEEKIKTILEVPKSFRVISLLPIGIPKFRKKERSRKELSQLVYSEKFTESS